MNFYTIDPATLGSDTEDDSADEASNEKEFSRLLMGEGLEEEKEAKGNILEQVMKEVNKMDHEGERRQIYDMELSIKDYELDPEVQTCMTDWPLKPYAGLEDIEAEKHLANDHLVPINYYDNEDGFWDNYIKEKQERQVSAGFITNRRYFKH